MVTQRRGLESSPRLPGPCGSAGALPQCPWPCPPRREGLTPFPRAVLAARSEGPQTPARLLRLSHGAGCHRCHVTQVARHRPWASISPSAQWTQLGGSEQVPRLGGLQPPTPRLGWHQAPPKTSRGPASTEHPPLFPGHLSLEPPLCHPRSDILLSWVQHQGRVAEVCHSVPRSATASSWPCFQGHLPPRVPRGRTAAAHAAWGPEPRALCPLRHLSGLQIC